MPEMDSQDLAPDLSSVLSVTGIGLITNFGNLGQNFGPQNGPENAYDQIRCKTGKNGLENPRLEAGMPRGVTTEATLGKRPPSGMKFSFQQRHSSRSLTY